MSIGTDNLYGRITISKKAIRAVAGIAALECYGIWGVGKSRIIRKRESEFKIKNGVRVWSAKNKIGIYIDVIVGFGMPINAVIESVRDAIKYKVENFSGMEVLFIDLRVMGIRK